jgi:hypothetical protein
MPKERNMHTYYALYVGVLPIPVGWFFKRHEAETWAKDYYPRSPEIQIRAFEFRWPPDSFDDRSRPSVFLATLPD